VNLDYLILLNELELITSLAKHLPESLIPKAFNSPPIFYTKSPRIPDHSWGPTTFVSLDFSRGIMKFLSDHLGLDGILYSHPNSILSTRLLTTVHTTWRNPIGENNLERELVVSRHYFAFVKYGWLRSCLEEYVWVFHLFMIGPYKFLEHLGPLRLLHSYNRYLNGVTHHWGVFNIKMKYTTDCVSWRIQLVLSLNVEYYVLI